METKKGFLAFLAIVLFTATLHAQCNSSTVNKEAIATGKKIILAEVSTEDKPENFKNFIGKTLEVGSAGITNIGDCWYLGELKLNGEDVFFIGVRVNAAQGETYEGDAPAPAAAITTADFPVGTRVKVYNYSETDTKSLYFFSDEASDIVGIVTESDLKKDANGKYSGCIMVNPGTYEVKKCFSANKVEKIQ